MSFYPNFPPVKPGPQEGSSRPAGAPNAGAQGGRPPTSGVVSASPMERLMSEIMPGDGSGGSAPPTAPDTVGQAAQPTAATSSVPGANPAGTTQSPASQSPVTINIGTGGGATPAGPAAPTDASGAPAAKPGGMEKTGEMWPEAQAGGAAAPLTPPAPPPVEFQRQPREDELALVPEGSPVITPYGRGIKKGGTVDRYELTPAGQEAHKRATLAARKRFGPTPFDGDLATPFTPPVVLDGWNFNPWAPPGQEWVK